MWWSAVVVSVIDVTHTVVVVVSTLCVVSVVVVFVVCCDVGNDRGVILRIQCIRKSMLTYSRPFVAVWTVGKLMLKYCHDTKVVDQWDKDTVSLTSTRREGLLFIS